MPNSVIKNPRRIVSQAGSASDPRVDTLAANEYKVLYWESVATASGTITVPTGATILLDQLQGGVDAYPSTISAGQPTGDFPQTTGSAVVTVSSFDASGNYTLSGTPSAFPVAIVYLLKISALNWSNLTTVNILEDEDYNLFLNTLKIGTLTTDNTQRNNGITIGGAFSGGYSGSVLGGYNFRTTTFNQRGVVVEDSGTTTGIAALEVRGYSNVAATRTTYQIISYGTGTVAGNYTGTSVPLAGTFNHSYSSADYASGFTTNGLGSKVDLASTHISLVGTTSTNIGTRLDATGLRVGALSTLHTANTVPFQINSNLTFSTNGNLIVTTGSAQGTTIKGTHQHTTTSVASITQSDCGLDLTNATVSYDTFSLIRFTSSISTAHNYFGIQRKNISSADNPDFIWATQAGGGSITERLRLTCAGILQIADAGNISVGTTTGTKIGTATSQKLSFWNVTPIIQPTTAVAAATFVANTSGIANDSATFDGYTIGQIVKALRNIGLLA